MFSSVLMHAFKNVTYIFLIVLKYVGDLDKDSLWYSLYKKVDIVENASKTDFLNHYPFRVLHMTIARDEDWCLSWKEEFLLDRVND